MNLKQLWGAAVKAGATCGQVMVLTAAASAFGWLLTVTRVPQDMASVFLAFSDSKIVFLLFCNVVFLIAGCFMDGTGAILILPPIMDPLGQKMGVDPVLLGVIITTNLAIGMITPPLGLNLFVANGITGVPMTRMIPAIIPFFFVSLIALLIVTYVPAISMFIPKLVYPGSF
jgi:C4-dicarboxylate transporter DctM subunit